MLSATCFFAYSVRIRMYLLIARLQQPGWLGRSGLVLAVVDMWARVVHVQPTS